MFESNFTAGRYTWAPLARAGPCPCYLRWPGGSWRVGGWGSLSWMCRAGLCPTCSHPPAQTGTHLGVHPPAARGQQREQTQQHGWHTHTHTHIATVVRGTLHRLLTLNMSCWLPAAAEMHPYYQRWINVSVADWCFLCFLSLVFRSHFSSFSFTVMLSN